MTKQRKQLKTQLARSVALAALVASSAPLIAEEAETVSGNWFQHARISPDGSKIAFSAGGNVFVVDAKGGNARALTLHPSYDGYPIWSADGSKLAFASDRYGNFDIFVMDANGGEATRLTHHSASDYPTDFSRDGSKILFQSTRGDDAKSSAFPRGPLSETYQVRLTGGTPEMLLTTPALDARFNSSGTELVYTEEKALESDLRKHDTGAFARDVWSVNLNSGIHTQLTTYAGGDHTPVWGDGGAVYLTSDRGDDNVFNVFERSASGNYSQLTRFNQHPVRHLSRADNGTLAFIQHGDLYTMTAGSAPERLAVSLPIDRPDQPRETVDVSGNISGFAPSPNGKEIVYTVRGEVFVTAADFSTTKRITDTAAQERSVDFNKDGRSIVYAAERDGKWKLIEATIADEGELYFFAATNIQEKILFEGEKESFQPVYSPDGKKVAFLYGRDEIRVVDRETGALSIALPAKWNWSYADGDISYSWSPDSKWMTATFANRNRLLMTNIAVFPADGSKEPVDISQTGYATGLPKWNSKGDAISYASTRFGQRDHSSWGREYDVITAFLTEDSFDEFNLSKEELALKKELEKKAKEAKEKAKKEAKEKAAEEADDAGAEAAMSDAEKEEEAKPKKYAFDRVLDRTVRMTPASSALADFVLTSDLSKLYYASAFNGGFELYEQNFREGSSKKIATIGAPPSFALSGDDKTLYVLSGGRLSKYALSDGSASKKPIATATSINVKASAERTYMFDHIMRQVADKFYDEGLHGVDWAAMRADYEPKLAGLTNNRDFARMMEELLGELNASHTGAYYRNRGNATPDATAALGVIFDLSDTSDGLLVAEVMDKSPLEKLDRDIPAGARLVAVNGTKLDAAANYHALMNRLSGQRVRLEFMLSGGEAYEAVIKPITTREETQLTYERWVKQRRELVNKASDGRLGYVHIRGMNDASYRQIYSDLMGMHFDTEAAIIDTRWNGGGWLHQDLAKLLSGKNYINFRVRGREYVGEPSDQWFKPTILVMGEGNYSDAHTFPYTYRTLGLGKSVGMPVPGTSTSVWWETLISGDVTFGIPQMCNFRPSDGQCLENKQEEPDYKVKNDPRSTARGEDKQLQKAVEIMLEDLGK